MVARRRQGSSPDEPAAKLPAGLRDLPESDEDPALFWGPDWKEKLDEALADAETGRGETFYSDEEFLAALEADSAR
jgi:hypothetical protein